jgi:hypothetical protein
MLAPPAAAARTSLSEDTASTFSCTGDLLPDEQTLTGVSSGKEVLTFMQVAKAFAEQQGLNASVIAPKLIALFEKEMTDHGRGNNNSQHPSIPEFMPKRSRKSAAALHKQPSLLAKASGLLNRLKTQVHTNYDSGHRVSFEAGDDTIPDAAVATESVETLHNRMSMPALPDVTTFGSAAKRSPPKQQQLECAARPATARRASRIPTPTYMAHARPRQEREGSSSSLLTSTQSMPATARNSSSTSPAFPQTITAASAASAAIASTMQLCPSHTDRRVKSNRADYTERAGYSLNASNISDMSESMKENVRPMTSPE